MLRLQSAGRNFSPKALLRDPRIMKAFKPNELFSLPLKRLNCVYANEISGFCFGVINILLDKRN